MPKISAPTLAEHRAAVRGKLVDAAEAAMRAGQAHPLTASSVSAAAGIARNSIYRYVDSVDDLYALVLARYLPDWLAAVAGELDATSEPGEQIVVWVTANLRQAAHSGHGWLMELGRGSSVSPVTTQLMDDAHKVMRDTLAQAWCRLIDDPANAQLAAGLTRGLLEAAFKQLDAGADAEAVILLSARATQALVSSLSDGSEPVRARMLAEAGRSPGSGPKPTERGLRRR